MSPASVERGSTRMGVRGRREGRKGTVLMVVFGETIYDGRVLRAAEALSHEYRVVLAGLGSCPLRPTVPVHYIQVRLPSGSRWLRHLLFFIRTVRIALRIRPSVVHAHDYFVALHGWLIARMTGAKSVYDAHEFLPGIKERSRLRHWLFLLLEQISIKRYDLVIATSQERARAIKDHYGLRELPVIVSNFAGVEEEILESSQDEQATNYELQDALQYGLPLVVYQGTMDVRSRCLDNLLRAFTGLRDNCVLLMVGDGPNLDYLRKLSDDLGLKERVFFTGRLSKPQLMSIMRAASIGVVIYSNREVNNLLCTPNKIHEYARAGLAVVTSNQPPLVQMLSAHPIGKPFDPHQPTTIQQAIGTVLSNLDTYRSRIPEFLAQHNWSKEKSRLLEAYAELVK